MVDVMIITFNEAMNLPDCLAALHDWAHSIFVIDSGSTDGTQDIARSFAAEVIHHDWEGYARQKNWGLRNVPFESPWVLIIDADEVVTPKGRQRIVDITSKPLEAVPENGFFINRLTYFLGRPIRHCGFFPSWNLRLFKRGKARYEDREVHEHVIIEDPVGYIRQPLLHIDQRGLEHYIAKHNRYSTLEARALLREISNPEPHDNLPNLTRATRLNRWLKHHILPWMPMPATWRFLYMYIIRLGFLDGTAGIAFCKFIGMYDYMLALKLREALRQSKHVTRRHAPPPPPPPESGLAQKEGSNLVLPNSTFALEPQHDGHTPTPRTRPEPSPWSFKEKCGRALWMLLGQPLFRMSFHNWHRFRSFLLRCFGAKIGKRVAIRPSVDIAVPWMLMIDDDATIGDYAILYSLGWIRIGKRSVISQYAHLCAGTHDYTDPTFKLIRDPIVIGHDVWVGTDAYVGPGVTVGDLSVVGARASVYKDLPPAHVYVGNPAKPLKPRVLKDPHLHPDPVTPKP